MSSTTPPTIRKCTSCGKTIGQNTRGSVTSWLFRKAECNCGSQQQAKEPLAFAEPSVTPSLVDAGTSSIKEFQPPELSQFSQLSQLSQSSALSHSGNERQSGTSKQAASNASGPSALLGQTIAGRYEILEHLGTGGMASVFRAADKVTGQVYALKMISSDLGRGHDDHLKRLEHEARAASTLSHVNICAVHDFGIDDNGAPYLVMEFIVGDNLETLLHRERLIYEVRALNIFEQVCEALVYAHGKGVVHCDIKPSNVLLLKKFGEQELVKVVDFGIARVLDQENVDKSTLIDTGEFIGSPLYMSPEQCRGEKLDERSDIYSLGCMIYELLSGSPPFVAENPVKVILKHLNEDARALPPSQSFPGLSQIVARCLEKSREKRYQSAAQLLNDLRLASRGNPLATDRGKVRFWRSPRFIFSSVAVVLVSGAIVAGLGSHLIKKNHAQWHEYDSQGKASFNKGLYEDAEAKFNKALSISTFAKQQQLESLQVLALLNHITGRAGKEAELNLRISDLKKSEPGEHLPILDRSSLRKVLNTLPQLSQPLRKSQAELAAFWVLYSAYLLDRDGNQNEGLSLIDDSLPLLTELLGAKSREILHLNTEKAQAMQQRARVLLVSGKDPSLALAKSLSELAATYDSVNVTEELRLNTEAVQMAMGTAREELDSAARGRAADIFSRQAFVLKKTGSSDWKRFQKMSEDYRFEN